MWEKEVNIDNTFKLQSSRPTTYFGVGAINKIDEIAKALKKRKVNTIMVTTDPISYKVTGAWDVIRPSLEHHDLSYYLYDGVRSNPSYSGCDEVAELAKENMAGAFLSIGGGSAHDTAKTAAALIKQDGKKAKDLYEGDTEIKEAAPIVAVNTTHGTGSEVGNAAVAQSDGGFKPAIDGKSLYPLFAVEDPALTKTLPEDMTISTTLDTVHHVFESATTESRNPYSIDLGMIASRLVFEWLPVARKDPKNIQARYWLMYASVIAGIAFDITGLHLTHALEHPMGALNPDTVHGTGLSAIFPAVVTITYRALPKICKDFFEPIVSDLEGKPGEAEYAAKEIEKWLKQAGRPEKLQDLGFGKEDIKDLTENTMKSPLSPALLGNAPIEATEEVVENIFRESLKPLVGSS